MPERLHVLRQCLLALLALVLVGGLNTNVSPGQRPHPALVTLLAEEEVQLPQTGGEVLCLVARKRASDPVRASRARTRRFAVLIPSPAAPPLTWRVPEARGPPLRPAA